MNKPLVAGIVIGCVATVGGLITAGVIPLDFSSSTTSVSTTPAPLPAPEPTPTPEPTQEELDAQLKSEAVRADFVELNANPEANIGKPLYADGEVSVIIDKGIGEGLFCVFMLGTEEGEGYGVYDVTILSLDAPDLSEGDRVIVWGYFHGKNEDTGIPEITATIIEKKQ